MTNKYRVVVYDHFDSFTFNFVTLLERLGATVTVIRTNSGIGRIERLSPTHLVLSPGYGSPKETIQFQNALIRFKTRIPIIGVCLGHQAMGLHFGAEVALITPMHGKTSMVAHDGAGLFKGVPSPFEACRYHSWAVLPKSIDGKKLVVNAQTSDGIIMAIQSVEYPRVVGVQFHPESLFTEHGSTIAKNFLSL